MTQSYFIGVDIGTTSTKAIVFSPSGVIKGISTQGYPLLAPEPGWAEQEPEAIFKAVIQAIHEAIAQANIAASDIAAVGFGAATHSLIAIDQHHDPLTNSITWADLRSVPQTRQLKQDSGSVELYHRTGAPIHPVSLVTKLMWLQQHQPDIFSKAAKFISVKEYVLYQLFGRYVVDYSIASASGLMNLNQLRWDDAALSITGIRPDQLSELVPTTYVLRGMNARYAEAIGLHPDTPVVVGANDGVLANLGVGAITSDQLAITIGTSAAVRGVLPKPLTDPQGRTFCYALTEDHWVVGGPSNNGGITLRWFRDQFGESEMAQAEREGVDSYDILIRMAEQVPAGAEGLLFLPFLSGERAPNWNPDARGMFFGIAMRHTRSHFIRSVLEGILFNIYNITTVLMSDSDQERSIRASGGFARSQMWRQMMADLFGTEVLIPEVYEASGFGGAALAMYAVGALTDLADVQPLIRISDRHQPNRDVTSRYQQLFKIHQRLYDNLVKEFSLIAEYQRQNS
jgi:gluconokinase